MYYYMMCVVNKLIQKENKDYINIYVDKVTNYIFDL